MINLNLNGRDTAVDVDPAQPLVVALVELAEGPRMMSGITGVAPEPSALELDMPLRADFIKRGDRTLPVFTPAGDRTGGTGL